MTKIMFFYDGNHILQPCINLPSENYFKKIIFMSESEVLQKVGSKIRFIRSTKNMTQKKLAHQCNFEKANMSRIESGQTNATILTLYKIATALEVQVGDLFND
jgi:DNA-binding XRE family transcriptional regulator